MNKVSFRKWSLGCLFSDGNDLTEKLKLKSGENFLKFCPCPEEVTLVCGMSPNPLPLLADCKLVALVWTKNIIYDFSWIRGSCWTQGQHLNPLFSRQNSSSGGTGSFKSPAFTSFLPVIRSLAPIILNEKKNVSEVNTYSQKKVKNEVYVLQLQNYIFAYTHIYSFYYILYNFFFVKNKTKQTRKPH